MSQEAMTNPNQSYDPMFDSLDDDFVLLVASDGICYRIPSFVLRCTSGFFRAMLTLPQVSDRPDSVTLDETSKVVGILLRMICGLERYRSRLRGCRKIRHGRLKY